MIPTPIAVNAELVTGRSGLTAASGKADIEMAYYWVRESNTPLQRHEHLYLADASHPTTV
jgi:hypothetical protein